MEAPEQPAQATTLPPSARPSRLFSNLNPSSLKHEPGSVLGAAALVAGSWGLVAASAGPGAVGRALLALADQPS